MLTEEPVSRRHSANALVSVTLAVTVGGFVGETSETAAESYANNSSSE